MPVSTGKTGRGVKFSIASGASPATFLAIANVTSINPSGREAEEIDFTHLGSEGGFREFRQGFKDAGTISIEYQFSPEEESHTELLELWNSGDVITWRVDFTDAGWDWYLEGQGYVSNPGDITVNVGDPIGGAATVRCTGPSEFVAA